jgi:ribosomal protein L33
VFESGEFNVEKSLLEKSAFYQKSGRYETDEFLMEDDSEFLQDQGDFYAKSFFLKKGMMDLKGGTFKVPSFNIQPHGYLVVSGNSNVSFNRLEIASGDVKTKGGVMRAHYMELKEKGKLVVEKGDFYSDELIGDDAKMESTGGKMRLKKFNMKENTRFDFKEGDLEADDFRFGKGHVEAIAGKMRIVSANMAVGSRFVVSGNADVSFNRLEMVSGNIDTAGGVMRTMHMTMKEKGKLTIDSGEFHSDDLIMNDAQLDSTGGKMRLKKFHMKENTHFDFKDGDLEADYFRFGKGRVDAIAGKMRMVSTRPFPKRK